MRNLVVEALNSHLMVKVLAIILNKLEILVKIKRENIVEMSWMYVMGTKGRLLVD